MPRRPVAGSRCRPARGKEHRVRSRRGAAPTGALWRGGGCFAACQDPARKRGANLSHHWCGGFCWAVLARQDAAEQLCDQVEQRAEELLKDSHDLSEQ